MEGKGETMKNKEKSNKGILKYVIYAILIEFIGIPLLWYSVLSIREDCNILLSRLSLEPMVVDFDSSMILFFFLYIAIPLLIFLYFSIMVKNSPEKFAWEMMTICLFLFNLFWTLMVFS